jgi:predicted metal-dependent enzyme (double-stranded beta helix superfamily)
VGEEHRLEPGQVECVSPAIGDVHRVANAYDDRVSVSIHLYGGNIGRIRRHVFDPETGAAKDFISGYSNAAVPNLWAPRPG